MRLFILFVSFLLSVSVAQATVDGHDRVFLVVEHIQSGEFFIERAPLIGCYGLPQGPKLAQWTASYSVPVNVGCGGQPARYNINALTCARVTKAVESSDFMSFSAITLNISRCSKKNNAQFITMVRTSAKLNFPQSNPRREVRLTLVK